MTTDELKKEAEEYAEEHAFRIPYDGSNKFYDDVDYKASVEAYLTSAEPREKRIAELEKENANLKLKLEALDGETPWKDIKDKSDVIGQLTKAKELIQDLFNILNGDCNDVYREETISEAENFLKDSEVEK